MKKLDKEFLASEFWRYFEEFKRVPKKTEMDQARGYPSITPYVKNWGSWTNFLKDIDVLGEDGWLVADEQVLLSLYESGKKDKIIESLLVTRSWSTIKQKAAKMGLKRNRSLAKRKVTNEEMLRKLKMLSIELNRTPRVTDLEQSDDLLGHKSYAERFGSWNEALRLIGLTPNTDFNVDKKNMIEEVKLFYELNQTVPKSTDVRFSRTAFQNYWSTWNDLLLESRIPITNKRWLKDERIEKYFNNNIDTLLDLAHSLNRIPMQEEYCDELEKVEDGEFLSRNFIKSRYDLTYREMCAKFLPEEILNSPNNNVFLDNEGNRCFSLSEMRISNFFLENGLSISREFPYRDVVNTDTDMRFDWKIEGEFPVYVEYFGLYRKDRLEKDIFKNYYETTHRKINLCKENSVPLIEIYEHDLRDGYLPIKKKLNKFGLLVG